MVEPSISLNDTIGFMIPQYTAATVNYNWGITNSPTHTPTHTPTVQPTMNIHYTPANGFNSARFEILPNETLDDWAPTGIIENFDNDDVI